MRVAIPAATPPLPQPSSPTCSVSTRWPPVIASSAPGPHRRGGQLITPLVFGGVPASLGTTMGQSAAASAGVVARHPGCPGPRTAAPARRAGPGCPVSHWALHAGNMLCLRPRPRGACAPDAPGRAAAYQHDLLLGVCCPARGATEGSSHRLSRPGPRIRALDCGRDPTAADGEEVRGHARRPVARPPPMEAGLVAEWKSPPQGSLGPPSRRTTSGYGDVRSRGSVPRSVPAGAAPTPLPLALSGEIGAASLPPSRRTLRLLALPLLAGGGTAISAAAARPAARAAPHRRSPTASRRPARRAGRAPPGYRRTCDRRQPAPAARATAAPPGGENGCTAGDLTTGGRVRPPVLAPGTPKSPPLGKS